METSLKSFQKSLTTLKEHLKDVGNKNALLDKTFNLSCATKEMKDSISSFQAKRTEEKVFDYIVFIISLYGQYETFIEKIITEYVNELKMANCKFSQLPQKLCDCYFAKGISLHSKLGWEKYGHLNKVILAESLYESTNKDIANILPEAFFSNAGNYKIDILASCLSELGIDNLKQEIRNYNPLLLYYKSKYGEAVNVKSMEDTILYSIIDEVVEARNKIAHTGSVDEIKDQTYVEEIISFFSLFGSSLNLIMQDAISQMKWNLSSNDPFQPVVVFKKMKVAGFKNANIDLHLNQDYICLKPKGFYPRYIESKVLGLMERGNSVDRYHLTEDNLNGVGIKINHDASDGCFFKFL